MLIHRGPSAYSGHYVAHIRDQKTDVWYKFNDEQIEKMGSESLTLCKEDEQGNLVTIIYRLYRVRQYLASLLLIVVKLLCADMCFLKWHLRIYFRITCNNI